MVNESDRARLEGILGSLPQAMRNRILRDATKRRKDDQAKSGRRRPRRSNRGDDATDRFEKYAPQRRDRGTVHDYALAILAERLASGELMLDDVESGADAPLDRRSGVVVGVIGAGVCRVAVDGEEFDCLLPERIAQRQKSHIAVGDEVQWRKREDRREVVEVSPRRTELARPDPRDPSLKRVIVANVDVVVIVVSLRSPPLRPRLIDRLAIAVQRGGAEAVLCVNKVDLATGADDDDEELRALRPYEEMDMPVVRVSAAERVGLDRLERLLRGRVCAFVGHSGVGKSSIVNALTPEARRETGQVRESDGRGRHTTTSSVLIPMAGGGRLIDTPGVRSFGLWDLTAEELAWSFPQFEAYANACRFRDCTHTHEPGCNVRDAVDAGDLNRAMFDTYLRLRASLEGGEG